MSLTISKSYKLVRLYMPYKVAEKLGYDKSREVKRSMYRQFKEAGKVMEVRLPLESTPEDLERVERLLKADLAKMDYRSYFKVASTEAFSLDF